ncbi:hypothetical protein OL239_07020 [Arthrobacter sp. ATA002]|uniref:hypothetical protein n=1 Tax=Arthrobacter sp. ATA002 TaxID=2991715 RepID=UPI0022A79595|nr:hypothetical protein [Arthrobacter sp. ATA002]WAP52887.1 hypothetical protein OL239_07020 [Arthrobacter sp. ATA002]
MIATLPLGQNGSEGGASQTVLSRVVRSYPDVRTPFVKASLNIDGGVGLSVARRNSLPVVLLPLFSECQDAAGAIVEAVYGLQQASLEFRIVVVTDSASFKQLRPFGWAISHMQPEATWSGSSWFIYAQDELERVIAAFGCSYVIETSELGISTRSWQNLLSIAGMGLDLPNTSLHASFDRSATSLHSSWRGWLYDVPGGSSTHMVRVDDREWAVEISKNLKSSMVFLQLGPAATSGPTNMPHDIRAGWNVVHMRPLTQDSEDRSEHLPGVLAIFDALSLDNCGILQHDDPRRSDFEAALPSAVQTNEVTESEMEAAYRRALSIWSS